MGPNLEVKQDDETELVKVSKPVEETKQDKETRTVEETKPSKSLRVLRSRNAISEPRRSSLSLPELAVSRAALRNKKHPSIKSDGRLATLKETEEVSIQSPFLQKAQKTASSTGDLESKQKLSASETCRNLTAWDIWSTEHHIESLTVDWGDSTFRSFMDNLKYPKYAESCDARETVNDVFSDCSDGPGACPDGPKEFNDWQELLSHDKLEDGDRYRFKRHLPALCLFWQSMKVQTDNNANEAGCRWGVDGLINLAFGLRHGAKRVWLAEQELALPDDPNMIKADAIVTISFPEALLFEVIGFAGQDNYLTFSWTYGIIPHSFIDFVVEYKKFNASASESITCTHQLDMDMFSAQNHRRALGIELPMFGATLTKGVFTLYVSFWDNKDLRIRSVLKSFDFTKLNDFVECYFVLCRISEFQSEQMSKIAARWASDRKSVRNTLQNSFQDPWRKDKKKDNSKRDEHDKQSQKSGRAAQGGNRDDCDEHGETCNECDDLLSESFYGATETEALDEEEINESELQCILTNVEADVQPKEGYPLTITNKKAFDIIADKSEADHGLHLIQTWVQCNFEYQEKREDPALKDSQDFTLIDPSTNSDPVPNLSGGVLDDPAAPAKAPTSKITDDVYTAGTDILPQVTTGIISKANIRGDELYLPCSYGSSHGDRFLYQYNTPPYCC